MKRLIACVFILMFSFTLLPATSYAACGDGPLDKAWDWVTTLGKDGLEKQKVLAENKGERLKKCAEKEAKKLKADAEKAGADAKKKLGL